MGLENLGGGSFAPAWGDRLTWPNTQATHINGLGLGENGDLSFTDMGMFPSESDESPRNPGTPPKLGVVNMGSTSTRVS